MWKDYYKLENEKVLKNYELGLKEVCEIVAETEKKEDSNSRYFNALGGLILKLEKVRVNHVEKEFDEFSLEELQEENQGLYKELFEENYDVCFGNPEYAVKELGEENGAYLSAFYAYVRGGIGFAYRNRLVSVESRVETFINLYKNNEAYKVKDIINSNILDEKLFIYERTSEIFERYGAEYDFYQDIIFNSDLMDIKYLYKYDSYISENEIKTVKFLQSYPVEKIKKLTNTAVQGYIRGFIMENKKRGNRDVVRLFYPVGQEIIIKQLIEDFEKENMKVAVFRVDGTNPNRQYAYDHRFDEGMYFDVNYTEMFQRGWEQSLINNESVMSQVCGIEAYESFGEKPFAPKNKVEAITLDKEQQELSRKNKNQMNQIFKKYYPSEETCFSIIAFPSPEIGDNFEEIFEETLKVNMMDNETYEPIQQLIIDALDKGEYVHIKGSNGNKTDIKVALQEIKNPDKETNFVNCVADVNIPLGEVFTSPKLTGTTGLLHLKETYLGLKYYNLELNFKDGFVNDFACSNFKSEEENKKYVKENLMRLHDTLPLGEFAIGTNTVAYVMAEKYKIIEKLPILIIEKMGPHFAIGDTCFSFAEDLPIYNLTDNKEVVARDNEKSIKRKVDVNEAYTGVHTDITIPYDEIGFINVILKNGEEISIIKDGRFVLDGTEFLNQPFEK
ncbi:MAG: aminopeptidase [Clostridium sp.]